MTRQQQLLLLPALTAVLVGYFMVWLPGPSAGLSFLGFELGEWVKFVGVRGSRNLFYVPPITLALGMVLISVPWPPGRWQNWGWRLLALAVSLLSFPAIEAILQEPTSEWLLRLVLIGSVMVLGLMAPKLQWLPAPFPERISGSEGQCRAP